MRRTAAVPSTSGSAVPTIVRPPARSPATRASRHTWAGAPVAATYRTKMLAPFSAVDHDTRFFLLFKFVVQRRPPQPQTHSGFLKLTSDAGSLRGAGAAVHVLGRDLLAWRLLPPSPRSEHACSCAAHWAGSLYAPYSISCRPTWVRRFDSPSESHILHMPPTEPGATTGGRTQMPLSGPLE